MTLTRFVVKNASRNKRRTALTAGSIALSLLLLTVLLMIWHSFYLMKGSPDSELRIVTRHRVSLTFYIPGAYRDKIRTVAGVTNVTPWCWFGGIYKDDKPENTFAQFGTDPNEVFKVFKDFRVDADQLIAFQRDRAGAAVARQLAEQHGWKLGDRLVLKGTYYPVNLELTIRAIFDAPDTWKALLFNFQYVEEAVPVFKGKIGTFVSLVDSPDAVGPVSKQIDDMFQNTGRPTRTESEKAFGLTFISLLGNVKAFILSIALAVSFAILLVSGNTMAMIVRERIREIAVMRTLGFSKSSILTMLVGEAVGISFVGGMVGVVAALGVVKLISQKASGSLLPPIALDSTTIVVALLLAAVVGVISSLIPSYSASQIKIVDGLRHLG